jgi:hypothetical protein
MKSLDFAAVAPGDATVDDEDDKAEGSSSASSSEEEQGEEESEEESEVSEEEQEEESADAFKDQTDYIPMIDEVKAEEKPEKAKAEEKAKVEEKPEEIPGFVKKSGLAVTAEAGIQVSSRPYRIKGLIVDDSVVLISCNDRISPQPPSGLKSHSPPFPSLLPH